MGFAAKNAMQEGEDVASSAIVLHEVCVYIWLGDSRVLSYPSIKSSKLTPITVFCYRTHFPNHKTFNIYSLSFNPPLPKCCGGRNFQYMKVFPLLLLPQQIPYMNQDYFLCMVLG